MQSFKTQESSALNGKLHERIKTSSQQVKQQFLGDITDKENNFTMQSFDNLP